MTDSQPKLTTPVLIIVMGVSGCGKSTTGAVLAHHLSQHVLPPAPSGAPAHVAYRDADTYHPQSNIEKMSKGVPLSDEDRLPWLELVRATALGMMVQGESKEGNASVNGEGEDIREEDRKKAEVVVFACSALKKSYRSILRGVQDDQLDAHQREDTLNPIITSAPKPSSHSPIPTYFIHLTGPRQVLLERMTTRKGHFFKEKMLDSQLGTLEAPDPKEEGDVVVVDIQQDTEGQVRDAIRGLERLGAIPSSSPRSESNGNSYSYSNGLFAS